MEIKCYVCKKPLGKVGWCLTRRHERKRVYLCCIDCLKKWVDMKMYMYLH